MHDDNDAFKQIMEKVGYEGRFQRTYSWVYVMGLTSCGAMIYMNLILALNVPDHWCHVPGMDKTNFTLDVWRTITLPKERDNRGEVKFSSCKMYSTNFTEIQHWDYENWNFSLFEKTVLLCVDNFNGYFRQTPMHADEDHTECSRCCNCVHGVQYDKQWYERTLVTDQDWVCEKEMYATNVFVVSRVTEVIGTFVFGQLSDTIGRRMVYYMSVIFVTLGRVISIVASPSYTWFIIATGISNIPICSFFMSAVLIAMEISEDDERTNIAMIQNLGWSAGTCFIPFVFWLLRDWVPFMWITTLPVIFVFFFHRYMIESPRWLISRRRYGDALIEFKKIAAINGREFNMTEKEITDMYSSVKKEKVYGMLSLFSQWNIARNTIIMGFSWCVVSVSYFTLYLFSSRMGGNPFLNFLLQSIVEVPSYFVGKYFGDKFGRRMTTSMCFLGSGILCIPILFVAPYLEYETIVVSLVTIIKFLNGVTFFVANLQEMEIYPTCVRQTGISLGVILANAVGILAPYFVYLGTNVDIRYPYYIMGTLFLLGGVSTLFLPETLHQKLPDTLEEALNFGHDQKFWSLPKAPRVVDDNDDDVETAKMNQKNFEH